MYPAIAFGVVLGRLLPGSLIVVYCVPVVVSLASYGTSILLRLASHETSMRTVAGGNGTSLASPLYITGF